MIRVEMKTGKIILVSVLAGLMNMSSNQPAAMVNTNNVRKLPSAQLLTDTTRRHTLLLRHIINSSQGGRLL